MAITPLTTIDWTTTGLVGLTGMEFWHQYGYAEDAGNIIYDRSGNGRNIACAASGAPVLTSNVINGQPAWYFDGTSNYLNYDGSSDPVTLKHLFILASADEATFSANRGLLSDAGLQTVLVGDTGTGNFFDYSASYDSTYRKNDTVYAPDAQQAPMGGTFALIEVVIPDGVTLNAIRVGQQYSDVSRKWKGYFVEQMGYSRVLSTLERRRILLHFNLRYRVFRYGVPLYFPDYSLVPMLEQPLVLNRFNDVPLDWQSITEKFEYEDKGTDFNEVADTVPRLWEYNYVNVPKAQKVVFDEFNNAARRANSFYFKDKEGTVWSNVHIESYGRAHEAHKRWRNDVPFTLIGYDSVPVYEGDPDTTPPTAPVLLSLTAIGTDTLRLTWSAADDPTTGGGYIEYLADDGGFLVDG